MSIQDFLPYRYEEKGFDESLIYSARGIIFLLQTALLGHIRHARHRQRERGEGSRQSRKRSSEETRANRDEDVLDRNPLGFSFLSL